MHDNCVDRGHHHPLAVVEPLQILGEARVIRARLQAAVFVALQDVLGNRPRLVNRYVSVIQHRDTTQRMTGAVLVGLEVLGVKIHAVQFVLEAELLEQPKGATGAAVGGKVQCQHGVNSSNNRRQNYLLGSPQNPRPQGRGCGYRLH